MVSVLMLVSLSGITDAIMEVLMSWGYVGMLLAAFLAGSFFPFSSEAVMLAFQSEILVLTLYLAYCVMKPTVQLTITTDDRPRYSRKNKGW